MRWRKQSKKRKLEKTSALRVSFPLCYLCRQIRGSHGCRGFTLHWFWQALLAHTSLLLRASHNSASASLFQSTYDYGRQLLQATVVLCQSLRCTSRSSGDTLPRLNRVWKQFTVASEERVHRLEMAIAFHSNAEKVCFLFFPSFFFSAVSVTLVAHLFKMCWFW